MVTLIYGLGFVGTVLAGAILGGSLGGKYNLLVPGILVGLIFGLIVGITKVSIIKKVYRRYNLGKLSAKN